MRLIWWDWKPTQGNYKEMAYSQPVGLSLPKPTSVTRVALMTKAVYAPTSRPPPDPEVAIMDWRTWPCFPYSTTCCSYKPSTGQADQEGPHPQLLPVTVTPLSKKPPEVMELELP